MGFKGLTVNTLESEEAHIFAEDDAAFFKCIAGKGNIVFPYGERFVTSATGSNKIKVGSGLLAVQGHLGTIPVNDFEEFILDNGIAGTVRYDLLVATFETTGVHGTDTFKLEVLSNQSYPTQSCEKGDLDSGATKVQYPLAWIKMDGLAISSIQMLNKESKTIADLTEELSNKIRYGVQEPSDELGKDGDIYIVLAEE